MQGRDGNVSKVSKRMANVPLSYQESIGKRGVGVLVDECRRQIEEHNQQRRSMSPYRGDVSDISGNGGYASVSARNVVIPTTTPFL